MCDTALWEAEHLEVKNSARCGFRHRKLGRPVCHVVAVDSKAWDEKM